MCEITRFHRGSFRVKYGKNSSHFKIFTLTPLVALAKNMRYVLVVPVLVVPVLVVHVLVVLVLVFVAVVVILLLLLLVFSIFPKKKTSFIRYHIPLFVKHVLEPQNDFGVQKNYPARALRALGLLLAWCPHSSPVRYAKF